MNSNIGRKYVDVNISWVFEIELPLVTNVTNTLYNMHCFPIPNNYSNIICTINLNALW